MPVHANELFIFAAALTVGFVVAGFAVAWLAWRLGIAKQEIRNLKHSCLRTGHPRTLSTPASQTPSSPQ